MKSVSFVAMGIVVKLLCNSKLKKILCYANFAFLSVPPNSVFRFISLAKKGKQTKQNRHKHNNNNKTNNHREKNNQPNKSHKNYQSMMTFGDQQIPV